MDQFVDSLLSLLIIPLQLVMTPIDALLNQIPNIAIIPDSITAITSFVGSIPSTLVHLSGISPILWNTLLLVYILFLGLVPTINMLKKAWAWIRP